MATDEREGAGGGNHAEHLLGGLFAELEEATRQRFNWVRLDPTGCLWD